MQWLFWTVLHSQIAWWTPWGQRGYWRSHRAPAGSLHLKWIPWLHPKLQQLQQTHLWGCLQMQAGVKRHFNTILSCFFFWWGWRNIVLFHVIEMRNPSSMTPLYATQWTILKTLLSVSHVIHSNDTNDPLKRPLSLLRFVYCFRLPCTVSYSVCSWVYLLDVLCFPFQCVPILHSLWAVQT